MPSATAQRGGNTTKSATATPSCTPGAVSTVKIDGSCAVSGITQARPTQWSKDTVFTTMNLARSYLHGA